MRLLCGADETTHMKATDCEMLDKYQVCIPCLHLFSFLFSLFTNSQTLFSAANLFLKMRPPVLLTHPPFHAVTLLFLCSCCSISQESIPNPILCLISSSVSFGTPFELFFQQACKIISNGNYSLAPSHHTAKAVWNPLVFHNHMHLCIITCPCLSSIIFLQNVHLMPIICALFMSRSHVLFS